MSVPNIPEIEGIHLTQGYEDISTDHSSYEGKNVLILGKSHYESIPIRMCICLSIMFEICHGIPQHYKRVVYGIAV